MKAAIVYDNGAIETYGDLECVAKNVVHGELSVTLEVNADANGVQYERLKGHRVKDGVIEFFGLDAIKKGVRIPKSDIRKGDLIRMKDHSEPVPGERDYKTLEYVATEDGDGSYRHNPGEKFYLLDRPKPELPTAPGSVVKARLKINPEQELRILTLGKDRVWAGPHGRASVETFNRIYELVEVMH